MTRLWLRIARTLGLSIACIGSAWAQFPSDFRFGDLATGTDFTIAGWFNAPSAQLTDAAFISNKNWDSGSNPGFVLTADARGGGTGHQFKVNANAIGGTRADTDWTDYSLNQWVYVVATFDRDGDLTAYINGGAGAGGSTSVRPTPQGIFDTDASPNFYDFNIGQDGTGNYSGGQGFIGLVDDVAIWRRALSEPEVSQLYTRGTTLNQSLGSLTGTSLNGGINNIDLGLVGYYGFNGNLNDAAGTAQNGIARMSGGGAGTVGFGTGKFGQAIDLIGNNYVTIGDAVPPGNATFTGNSAANNNASTVANWDLNPATLTVDQGIVVANGTTATFSGANTGPAIFDGTFPVTQIKNFTFGAAGSNTFINFQNSGGGSPANLIGVGAVNSIVGASGSNVTMNFSGAARLDHSGFEEESTEMIVAEAGATVNITMSGTSELAAGPKVADAAYATGFRRPVSTDPPGTRPRLGDDMKFGNGNDAGDAILNLTMNESSQIFVADVLQPGNSNNSIINVVQNDNSRVIANWDTRFTEGGINANKGVNWTLNGNSQFLVARDHGLGENGGAGYVNVTVNDNAKFFAGDRIAIGADGGNVTVTVNGGLMKVGGNAATDVILVDETGEVPPGAEPVAVDWILNMGAGANARLNVNGGRVEVGRSAYIGRGGGTANVTMNGGVFEVKGVGPVGTGLGNTPTGSIPGGVSWSDNGGDTIVGYDDVDVATFGYFNGQFSTARDFIVSFDNDLNGIGGDGTLRNVTHTGAAGSFTVGNDLSFGGDFFGPSGGDASLNVGFKGATLTPITVNGDLYIFNSGNTVSDFSLTMEPGGLPPVPGQYVLIDYAGTRSGDNFTELPAAGITYNLIYDNVNTRVILNITAVNLLDGDFNNDGNYNCTDVNSLVATIAAQTNASAFDLTGDGFVNGADLTFWLAQAGTRNLPNGNPYLVGDANLDGVVDGSDFGIWNSNKFTATPAWCSGDFNADGNVDGSDFGLWNANKFRASDSGTLVPEPAVGSLLGLAACGWLARRRR